MPGTFGDEVRQLPGELGDEYLLQTQWSQRLIELRHSAVEPLLPDRLFDFLPAGFAAGQVGDHPRACAPLSQAVLQLLAFSDQLSDSVHYLRG
ncbi:hypothetical protein D3C72_2153590 [compost metagenome]